MSTLTVEMAYQALAEVAVRFAPDPNWEKLRLEVGMFGKSISHTGYCYSENGSESYFVIPLSESDEFADACYFLRDDLRGGEGTEVYGFDFILKRDGKMTINYNYEPPKGA